MPHWFCEGWHGICLGPVLLRGRLVLILFLGGPGGWCQLADFFVRGAGDALEDVGEVGVWVDAASATAFYDAVDDGAAVAGVSSADKSSHPEGISPSGFSQNRT